MFGKDESLREALSQYYVDYREKLSDEPAIRWSDRLAPDGTWAGNHFQFYSLVIRRLSADLKVPFQLDADLFRKGETIVHEAIREALVNALIHADYRGMGGVVVEKYPDHFSTLEVQALVTVDIEKRVDNRRLQQITGEHAVDITELFQTLVAGVGITCPRSKTPKIQRITPYISRLTPHIVRLTPYIRKVTSYIRIHGMNYCRSLSLLVSATEWSLASLSK